MYILIPVKFISFHFKCDSSGCVFSEFYGSSYPVICESIWNHQLNFPGWPEAKSGDLQSCKTSFFTKPQIVQKNSLVLSVNIRTQVKSCSKSDGDTLLFYVPSPTAPLIHSFLPALNCMTSSAETSVTLQKDQSSERTPPPCVCVYCPGRCGLTSRCDGKSWELNDRAADDDASILLREHDSLYFHCHCSLKRTSSHQFPFFILLLLLSLLFFFFHQPWRPKGPNGTECRALCRDLEFHRQRASGQGQAGGLAR